LFSYTTIFAQEGLTDCKHQCKVSRLVEEGVLLGVRIQDVSSTDPYAYIVEVLHNTSAEKSGLQMGNIIQKVDDIVILNKDHLIEVIHTHKAGDKVLLTFQSGEKIKTMKVRLGAMSTKIVEVMECCDEIKNEEEVVIEEGISVYPSPASNVVHIQTKEALEGDVHIMIYSITGREVYYNVENMNKNVNIKVNTSEYTNGSYFVRIETAKKNYIQKFEIQK
jgi:hypothetical protein